MNQDIIFTALADRFVNYQKLSQIPIFENNEKMVDVENYGLQVDLSYSKLEPSTGAKLILREGVCQNLVRVEAALKLECPDYKLILVYAYRSLDIQRTNFEKMKRELGFGDRTDPIAMENTHHFIAVPDVAGHPTGGAIDLLILDENNVPLDFGTPMHGLEKNSYVFSPFISGEATLNRKLLRKVMQAGDFAPYDGEWWHFSYGDREWAAYYNETQAIYTQLEYEA